MFIFLAAQCYESFSLCLVSEALMNSRSYESLGINPSVCVIQNCVGGHQFTLLFFCLSFLLKLKHVTRCKSAEIISTKY